MAARSAAPPPPPTASYSSLSALLASAGLSSKYRSLLAQAGVSDTAALRGLSDAYLAALGLPVGARRRLQAAQGLLQPFAAAEAAAAADPSSAPSGAAPSTSAAAAAAAARRQPPPAPPVEVEDDSDEEDGWGDEEEEDENKGGSGGGPQFLTPLPVAGAPSEPRAGDASAVVAAASAAGPERAALQALYPVGPSAGPAAVGAAHTPRRARHPLPLPPVMMRRGMRRAPRFLTALLAFSSHAHPRRLPPRCQVREGTDRRLVAPAAAAWTAAAGQGGALQQLGEWRPPPPPSTAAEAPASAPPARPPRRRGSAALARGLLLEASGSEGGDGDAIMISSDSDDGRGAEGPSASGQAAAGGGGGGGRDPREHGILSIRLAALRNELEAARRVVAGLEALVAVAEGELAALGPLEPG